MCFEVAHEKWKSFAGGSHVLRQQILQSGLRGGQRVLHGNSVFANIVECAGHFVLNFVLGDDVAAWQVRRPAVAAIFVAFQCERKPGVQPLQLIVFIGLHRGGLPVQNCQVIAGALAVQPVMTQLLTARFWISPCVKRSTAWWMASTLVPGIRVTEKLKDQGAVQGWAKQ